MSVSGLLPIGFSVRLVLYGSFKFHDWPRERFERTYGEERDAVPKELRVVAEETHCARAEVKTVAEIAAA